MANWFYYDASGQKQGPIDNAQFGALVNQGIITRETVVENEQGKSAPAGRVKGLVFPEAKQPEIVPPVETEIYGLSSPVPSPPAAPSPFTAPTPVESNPFTAPVTPSTPSEASSSKISWESVQQNGMRFLRWVLPILKKGGEKAMEAAKKGGEMAVEVSKKAAPHVKAQLDKIPVESLKEKAIQQIDKLPGGRKRIAVIAGAVLLVLLGGWWMSSSPRTTAVKQVSTVSPTVKEAQAEPSKGNIEVARKNDVRNTGEGSANRSATASPSAETTTSADADTGEMGSAFDEDYVPESRVSSTSDPDGIFGEQRGDSSTDSRYRRGSDAPSVADSVAPSPTGQSVINVPTAESAATPTGTTVASNAPRTAVTPSGQAEVDAFCAKHGTDVKEKNKDGETLLQLASKTEGVAVIRFLIDKGADINEDGWGGNAPLHYAAVSNTNPEVIKLLIEKGADVNAINWKSKPPLHYAAEYNPNPEVIKLLIEKGAKWQQLNWSPLYVAVVVAVVNENLHDVQKLLDEGKEGATPQVHLGKTLHYAVRGNKGTEVIKLLIEKGANVNENGEDGDTPLHRAVASKPNPEVIKLLIEKGADVNATSRDGLTPLHYAAEYNTNPEVSKLLIEKWANVNAKGKDGDTPLHYAAEYNTNPEVSKLLIEKGANVNAKNKVGLEYTPLHHAAASNTNPEVIKLLIEKGAGVNVENHHGWTPFYLAVESNTNPEVIKLLIENGADFKATGEDGKELLQRAKNADVREYLAHIVAKAEEEQEKQYRAEEERKIATLARVIGWNKNVKDIKNLTAEFEKSGCDSAAQYHQRDSDGIARTIFIDEYPYSTSAVKAGGGEVSATITLDTGFFAKKTGEFASPFPDVKCPSDSETSPQIIEYAFLTKDDTLRMIPKSQERKMIKDVSDADGLLYARFQKQNNVTFTIRGGTESMKELVRNSDNYRVVVLFTGLKYSSKTVPVAYRLINSDGTLRTGKFVDAFGEPTISNPFVTAEREEVEEVSAEVMKIVIVKGKSLYWLD